MITKIGNYYIGDDRPPDDFGSPGDRYDCTSLGCGFVKELIWEYGDWGAEEDENGPITWSFETVAFNSISPGPVAFASNSANKPTGATQGVAHIALDRTVVACWGSGDDDCVGAKIVDANNDHFSEARLVNFGETLNLTDGVGWAILYEDPVQPGKQFLLDYLGNWKSRSKTSSIGWQHKFKISM